MAKANKHVPEGVHSITPHLVVKGAAQAIDFYKRAFGAEERDRMAGPGGVIMHASLRIGDSPIFLNDEMPGQQGIPSPTAVGGTTVVLTLYVEDCDKVYNAAIAAGATSTMPLADQFWGDRYGQVKDPFGHIWAIATHKEDLTPAEMEERGRQFMAEMSRH